ncbi:MAG: glycosyltransferase family 2 protein [Planctomyces sp.]|nr:glycosyltransferase family 2 protein [Planctomyces sp.]
MNPTVSVLLPAYNAARFIDQTIESVVGQTFSDWELVAVDDVSSDATFERLQDWTLREPRLRLFRNETNRGMTANWNRCLEEARGTYIVKLDADDAFRPKTLEVLVNAMSADDIVGAGVRTLRCTEADLEPFDGQPADDAMINAGFNPYEDQTRGCDRWYNLAALGNQLWHSCGYIVRREFLQRRAFDERFGCCSDTEMILRMLECEGRFVHNAYVGVLYRQVQGSISHQFQANNWRTWEGCVVLLLSISRAHRARLLPRSVMTRYAQLWNRWRHFRGSAEFEKVIPPAIRERLDSAMSEVPPPPWTDRAICRARQTASRLLRG